MRIKTPEEEAYRLKALCKKLKAKNAWSGICPKTFNLITKVQFHDGTRKTFIKPW